MSGPPSLGDLAATWQLDPGLLASAAAALGAYGWGVARAKRARRAGTPSGGPAAPGRAWPARRAACFALGVLAALAALCSGLDVYADELLSVHMVQHLVLTLVAAPLLVAGSPLLLALRALPGGGRSALARGLRSRPVRALTHPAATCALLPAAMIASQLTGIYELTLRDPLAHALEHLVFLVAAILFWLPLLGREPLRRRPGLVGRMLYLLVAMPAMALPGVVLTLDRAPRYAAYLAPARALGVDPLRDQQLAGTIMWVPGSVLAAALTLLVAWLALVQEERRALAREARLAAAPPLPGDGGAR